MGDKKDRRCGASRPQEDGEDWLWCAREAEHEGPHMDANFGLAWNDGEWVEVRVDILSVPHHVHDFVGDQDTCVNHAGCKLTWGERLAQNKAWPQMQAEQEAAQAKVELDEAIVRLQAEVERLSRLIEAHQRVELRLAREVQEALSGPPGEPRARKEAAAFPRLSVNIADTVARDLEYLKSAWGLNLTDTVNRAAHEAADYQRRDARFELVLRERATGDIYKREDTT